MKFQVLFPHPDPCYIISNPQKGIMTGGDNSLLIFSDEEMANSFMRGDKEGYVLERFSWNELVDEFAKKFASVTVDRKRESGYYSHVPLVKGI